MLDHIRQFLTHAEWANAVFFGTWGKSPARDHEELRRRVGHVIGVQEGFLKVFRGEPVGMPPDGPPPSFDQLKTWAERNHGDLGTFAATLDSAALARTVRIPWFPDPPCIISVGDALTQVVMHTQHHRGQLMTRLKDLGGEPKNVDWIIWLWKGRPAPRWG